MWCNPDRRACSMWRLWRMRMSWRGWRSAVWDWKDRWFTCQRQRTSFFSAHPGMCTVPAVLTETQTPEHGSTLESCMGTHQHKSPQILLFVEKWKYKNILMKTREVVTVCYTSKQASETFSSFSRLSPLLQYLQNTLTCEAQAEDSLFQDNLNLRHCSYRKHL